MKHFFKGRFQTDASFEPFESFESFKSDAHNSQQPAQNPLLSAAPRCASGGRLYKASTE